VYFTEIPMPGVPGGANGVSVFDGSQKTILHMGEPEPTDIVVGRDGRLYWTCKSAGVILTQFKGETHTLLSGLDSPVGIALDHKERALFLHRGANTGDPWIAGGPQQRQTAGSRNHAGRVNQPGRSGANRRNRRSQWSCLLDLHYRRRHRRSPAQAVMGPTAQRACWFGWYAQFPSTMLFK